MADAKSVLKMIQEKEVKFVDLRFTDPRGKWQHVTFDLSMIDEDLFVHGTMFDGSSIAGWKAINESDLGINPSNDGKVIRLAIPQLTEERRKELTKVVRSEGENAKIAVRNLRRDANEAVKKLVKDKLASEDDQKRAEADIQKVTDKHIADIDKLIASKEQEIMAV